MDQKSDVRRNRIIEKHLFSHFLQQNLESNLKKANFANAKVDVIVDVELTNLPTHKLINSKTHKLKK